MRHGKKINHLGRTSSHRKAMFANMASSLILNKRIKTTTAKAKALRTYVEPLITKAKDDNTHSRRMVFSYLQDKGAVAELFRDVAEKVGERQGGYTRILKTGNRLGDNAEMCFLELVDYNETYTSTDQKQSGASRRKRRRRGGKKKTQTQQQTQEAVEEQTEETSEKPVEETTEKQAEGTSEKQTEETQTREESTQEQTSREPQDTTDEQSVSEEKQQDDNTDEGEKNSDEEKKEE